MKGRKTMIGLTFINPQYIQEAEFETVSGNSESGKPKTGHLKILLIAAMVSTMLLLTGAGLYTRWSNTAQVEGGETMLTEKGAMSWMSPNMKMETTTGGGIGKMFGRAFSGESMFINRYTAQGGTGLIAFASSFPGDIRAFEIAPGQEIVAQKSAFLASTAGVEMSVFFQKRIAGGLFGGEGFIMQRLSGNGTVFLEFDGHIKEYELAPGQQIVVDTGYLAAMTAGCSIDIQTVPGVKNMLFGGEPRHRTSMESGAAWE